MPPGLLAASRRRLPLGLGLGVDVGGALNFLGSLIWPLGFAFFAPAAVAVGYGEPVWPFLGSAAITFALGLGLQRLTTGRERIGAREGFLVVSVLWLLVAALGALPYLLAEPQLSRPSSAAAPPPWRATRSSGCTS